MASNAESIVVSPDINYCRVCFSNTNQLDLITIETIYENFFLITNLRLIKMENHSNLVCLNCVKKLMETRKYRDELINNERRLMNQINEMNMNENVHDDPLHSVVKPKEEPVELVNDDEENFEQNFKIGERSRSASESMDNVDNFNEYDDEDDEYEPPLDMRKKKPKKKGKVRKSRAPRNETATKHDYTELDQEIANLPDDENVQCSRCSKVMRKKYFRQHMLRVHYKIKDYSCDRCGRSFYAYNVMLEHMNLHLKLRPFACPLNCGKSFHSRSGRKDHVRMEHTKKNDAFEFICELCAKKFKTKFLLKSHIAVHHKDFRFKCTQCSKEFISESGLRVHKNIWHQNTCKICSEKVEPGEMYNHKRIKHSDFACSFCNQHFPTTTKKKLHEKRHLGERDYVCTICSSKFFNRAALNRHFTARHLQSKFHCVFPGCKSSLSTRENLRAHIKAVHKSLPSNEREQLLKMVASAIPDYGGGAAGGGGSDDLPLSLPRDTAKNQFS